MVNALLWVVALQRQQILLRLLNNTSMERQKDHLQKFKTKWNFLEQIMAQQNLDTTSEDQIFKTYHGHVPDMS